MNQRRSPNRRSSSPVTVTQARARARAGVGFGLGFGGVEILVRHVVKRLVKGQSG